MQAVKKELQELENIILDLSTKDKQSHEEENHLDNLSLKIRILTL